MIRCVFLIFGIFVGFWGHAREIEINFSDITGNPVQDVKIEVIKSTIDGSWAQLRGIKNNIFSKIVNEQFILSIDEKAYTLTFSFKKDGFFPEKWIFPVYSTDKNKNIRKQIIFIPNKKNENICISKKKLTLNIQSDKKNYISINDLIGKNIQTSSKESYATLYLDMSRDSSGKKVIRPISSFNTNRFWPKAIILKLKDARHGDGFILEKNDNFKEMIIAPENGYSPALEIDPRKYGLFFYFLIDEHFGKGIIHSLNKKKNNQWEMTIIFITNKKFRDNCLQCDFDYDNY